MNFDDARYLAEESTKAGYAFFYEMLSLYSSKVEQALPLDSQEALMNVVLFAQMIKTPMRCFMHELLKEEDSDERKKFLSSIIKFPDNDAEKLSSLELSELFPFDADAVAEFINQKNKD